MSDNMENAAGNELFDRDSIQTLNDSDANKFNIRCLAVLSALSVISELLNELGVFKVDRRAMIPAMALTFALFFAPVAIYLIHDRVRKKGTPVVETKWFRRLIIIFAFAGITLVAIAMSFHSAVLSVAPILIAAQYRFRKREFALVLAAAVLLVPIGIYGSFFFGTPDRNLFKGLITDEEALVFANRVALATSKRMFELFIHYVLPRMFCVIMIAILAYGIARRNEAMLDRQIELAKKISDEMDARHEAQNHVIEMLADLIESRDADTGTHILHTKKYVEMIALAMRNDDKYRDIMTETEIERLKNAAPLHDIGKIVIPDTILLKPGKLTAEEFEKMKTHTSAGETLIKKFFSDMDDADFLKTAEQIAVAHHEKWDGSGYPTGLAGEDIPLSARIMAVADVYDALVSVRVYKASLDPEKALEVIFSESGTHFDPDIIRIVRGISDQMIAVARSID